MYTAAPGSVAAAVLLKSGVPCSQWVYLPDDTKHRIVYGVYAQSGQLLNGYGRSKIVESVNAYCALTRGAGFGFPSSWSDSGDNTNSSSSSDSNNSSNNSSDNNSSNNSGGGSGGFNFTGDNLSDVLKAGFSFAATYLNGLNAQQRQQAQQAYETKLLQLRGQLGTNPLASSQYNQLLQYQSLFRPQSTISGTTIALILAGVGVVGIGVYMLSRQGKKS